MTKRAIEHVGLVAFQKHYKRHFRMIQQIEAENADGFHYYLMVPRWRQINRATKMKKWEREW